MEQQLSKTDKKKVFFFQRMGLQYVKSRQKKTKKKKTKNPNKDIRNIIF